MRVLEWFGGVKRFPHAQQVAQILSHGVPVRVNGVGDLKAALQYSNHNSINQYTGHFVAKVAEDVRLGRAFIFPREMASRIPGLRVSPVGVAVSATKVRIIHDLTMAFSNPGVNGDTNFESAPKCKLGHLLRDIVWRILFLRRTLAPHTHIMLSKMDVKDAFRQVAVEWDGCTKFGYVLGDFVVVDRRLVFGWRNSPGFYCLLVGPIEHAHGSTSFDDAVVTPQELAATRHVRVDIPAAGETPVQLPPECRVPLGQGGGATGTFWARSYVDDTIGVEPLVCARGSRCLRASTSLASDHFRLFGSRFPTDPRLLAPAKVSSWSTSLGVLGWTIDTVAMVISLTSAKLLQLCILLEAWPPSRTVASEYELRSLMGKLLHVSEVVRPGKCFVRRIINQLGTSPVRLWDERFGVLGAGKGRRKLRACVRLSPEFHDDISFWSRSTIGRGGGVTNLSPFREGMVRK